MIPTATSNYLQSLNETNSSQKDNMNQDEILLRDGTRFDDEEITS